MESKKEEKLILNTLYKKNTQCFCLSIFFFVESDSSYNHYHNDILNILCLFPCYWGRQFLYIFSVSYWRLLTHKNLTGFLIKVRTPAIDNLSFLYFAHHQNYLLTVVIIVSIKFSFKNISTFKVSKVMRVWMSVWFAAVYPEGQINKAFLSWIGYTCTRAYFIAQSCLTLPAPEDCNLPGSSVHGIFQVRILEWVASFSSCYIFAV